MRHSIVLNETGISAVATIMIIAAISSLSIDILLSFSAQEMRARDQRQRQQTRIFEAYLTSALTSESSCQFMLIGNDPGQANLVLKMGDRVINPGITGMQKFSPRLAIERVFLAHTSSLGANRYRSILNIQTVAGLYSKKHFGILEFTTNDIAGSELIESCRYLPIARIGGICQKLGGKWDTTNANFSCDLASQHCLDAGGSISDGGRCDLCDAYSEGTYDSSTGWCSS